jgi:hypothetical protein
LKFDRYIARQFGRLERESKATVQSDRLSKAQMLENRLFDKQLTCWRDRNRRKIVLCPRRSGKSYYAMITAIVTCLRKSAARVVIINLSLQAARDVYWWEMQALNEQFDLGLKFMSTTLEIEFPNSSRIKLFSADTERDVEKLRGGQYDYVVIDEAKSYPARMLKYMIEEVLAPSLSDRMGRLLMIGTPGSILDGPFYQYTTSFECNKQGTSFYSRPYAFKDEEPYAGKKCLWSFHSWTSEDTTAMPHIWEESLEQKDLLGYDDDHPTWRREFLGQWCATQDDLVYPYDPEVNAWEPDSSTNFGLPEGHVWRFLVGVDLGYNDDTAISVGAYSPTHPTFFHVYTEKLQQQDYEQAALRVKYLSEMFDGFDAWIVDTAGGGSKMICEGWNRIYNFAFEPADKQQKNSYIELMAHDMRKGRCKILRNSALAWEMQLLQWDMAGTEKGAHGERRREDPRCANHACDSFLYLWRYAYHHFFKEQKAELQRGSEEWWKNYQKEERMKVIAEQAARNSLEGWEKDLDFAEPWTEWN